MKPLYLFLAFSHSMPPPTQLFRSTTELDIPPRPVGVLTHARPVRPTMQQLDGIDVATSPPSERDLEEMQDALDYARRLRTIDDIVLVVKGVIASVFILGVYGSYAVLAVCSTNPSRCPIKLRRDE